MSTPIQAVPAGPVMGLVLLAALALPPVARAADSRDDCTGIISSVPATVTTPGTYCLDRNLTLAATSGAAINLGSHITLDCKGFQLSGSGGAATNAIGVAASTTDNVTVRNCTIRGFEHGIQITHINLAGDGHLIEDNLLDANTESGLTITAESALVRRNRIRNTGGATSQADAYGIQVNGGASVQVLDNSIVGVRSQQSARGIRGGLVRGNRVSTIEPGIAGSGFGISTTFVALANQVSGVTGGASTGIFCGEAAIGNTVIGSAVPIDPDCRALDNVVVP